MPVNISPGSVIRAVATGSTTVFVPAVKVRELALAQPPVSAFGGHLNAQLIDVVLGDGTITAYIGCSGDATIVLGAIPLPQVRAAVAANKLLGQPVSVTPRFTVASTLRPRLGDDLATLHASLADLTIVNFQPLHGAPLGIGNLLTDTIGTAVGATYRASGHLISGASSAVSRGASSVGAAASNVAGRVAGLLPKRFRRKSLEQEPVELEPVVESEAKVAQVVLEKAEVQAGGFKGNPKVLLMKLANQYLAERPVLKLPEEYGGVSIAGLVRGFKIMPEGIEFYVNVDENPTWRRRRHWLLYGAAGLLGAVGLEWFATGTFLWF